MTSTVGRLLVATPAIGDPNFDRTTILVLQHDEEGALGLVLDRPMEAGADELMPDWAPLVAPPASFFQGGPVGLDGVVGLADGPPEPGPGWSPLLGRLGTVDLSMTPNEIGAEVEAVRLFAGHSGWSAGQLDAELDAEAWFVVDVHVDDVFTSSPQRLWVEVLRRQPQPLSWLANYPLDPAFN